jgi:histidine triad (HIT) family protein
MPADCPHCVLTVEPFLRTELCFAVWAHEPPQGGVLICPRAHRETVFDLSNDEWSETFVLLDRVRPHIVARVDPDGFNVGWNVFAAGGQVVPHAHLHVVPRWSDEPHAGKGLRWWIKQPNNQRPREASG